MTARARLTAVGMKNVWVRVPFQLHTFYLNKARTAEYPHTYCATMAAIGPPRMWWSRSGSRRLSMPPGEMQAVSLTPGSGKRFGPVPASRRRRSRQNSADCRRRYNELSTIRCWIIGAGPCACGSSNANCWFSHQINGKRVRRGPERVNQGLKPTSILDAGGMAEAMP